ncbi:Acetyltransferase (GNAT) family protein [Arthrobacter saudimassiliensis]|uniref:Acetyltransferase (GNAT) family protein n=1 Tax=Arthrobacter saudimassiliensis TaxID=1461584 RepID=A0A078MN00_9MICC|nr:Acetyltransferase (GNAT) family protein [Arthrobacter saudimassiliensis]
MAKVLARVAPWLPSARNGSRIRSGQHAGSLRILAREDTAALRALADEDPVANIFIASHLETAGSAAPTVAGGQVVGAFDDGRLLSACWAGVNLVPVGVTADTGPELGAWLARSGRRFSSVFGPAEGVLSIWSELQHASPRPFAVRESQPLLQIDAPSPVAPAAGLRHTRPAELDVLLPACTAMFEEEVGYSPVAGGDRHYRNRVRGLIQRGHSLAHITGDGEVVFKAELGTVSRDAVQIQGVWMNPRYRGQGRSAGYMSAVVAAALEVAPRVSLYVNHYNERARSLYAAVGFRQVGTFATVLF